MERSRAGGKCISVGIRGYERMESLWKVCDNLMYSLLTSSVSSLEYYELS